MNMFSSNLLFSFRRTVQGKNCTLLMIGCIATGIFGDPTTGSKKENILLLYSLPDLHLLQGKRTSFNLRRHPRGLHYVQCFHVFCVFLLDLFMKLFFAVIHARYLIISIFDIYSVYHRSFFVEIKSLTIRT